MSVTRRNNLDFPSLMNEIFKPDWFGGMENTNSTVPPVNIKENEREFELELVVPGRKKEDFNIEIEKNVLTISSETKQHDQVKEESYTRREFGLSPFKRAFSLPETIDNDKIEADYENGLLKFVLPKKEEALPRPKRMIELS